MALLITGFEPFAGVPENPSALVVRALAEMPALRAHVHAEVLPTAYDAAARRVRQLIDTIVPDAYIALGYGGGDSIRLESAAYNLDDIDIPDNDGDLRTGLPIAPDAPPSLAATLPVKAMLAALTRRGIPATISDDPGRFVCNHVLFRALHLAQTSGRALPCGFIHLPMHAEAGLGAPSLPLSMMIEAVLLCLSLASG